MNCDPSNPNGCGVVNVWQETVPIRFGAIDKSDRLTLDAVFQFFQEAATSHAENLGVGREAMAESKQAWILSRISVFMEKRPKYKDTVTVSAWPCGFEKLFAIRDYEIKDKDDKVLVSGSSAWLIVDMEKRRPLRPQSVMDILPLNEGLKAMTPESGAVTGLTVRENLTKVCERKANYTDLDYYKHVNNVSYIKWIEDSIDPQILENADKMRLDINYLNEILAGETFEILSAQIDDDTSADKPSMTIAFEGRKTESGQASFRAELRLW